MSWSIASEPMVGIDLGTTHSLVAIYRDGRPMLVPNAAGQYLTPSAVSVDPNGTVLVGAAALERKAHAPQSTATAFKRWMGSDRRLTLGGQSFRPEELSALVLGALKRDVEHLLKAPVHKAVITVPAYFNQAQRAATIAAAQLAGFAESRLLNEPTAAGLAYGLAERPEHTTFLVFDLGGGTFDVSVLEYFEGVVQVRASAGDTRLGGEDYVHALGEWLLQQDRRSETLPAGKLWYAAEQAKRALSEQTETIVVLGFASGNREQSLTRADFERITAGLTARLRQPIERALRDARLNPDQLDEVVLVGGATRMPLVRKLAAQLFQRLPLRHVDPDQTIALGAAIQAAMVARNQALDEVVLTDVMPFTLGVGLVEDRYSPIIERNSPVPISRVQTYQTVRDNQTAVQLEVRQGESPVASENLLLCEVEIPVIARPAGQSTVNVRLSYDASGLLEVDVTDNQTGRAVQRVVHQRTQAISGDQLAAIRRRLEQLKIHPRDQDHNRQLIERAKRLYEDRLGQEREQVQHWLWQFEQALATQDHATAERARLQFETALNQIDKPLF